MNLAQILRRHARAPAFTLIALLLVGVAVAINATTFGALHAVRWKALPFADGDRLVELKVEMSKVGFQFGLADRFRDALLAGRAPFDGVLGTTPQAVSRYLADDGTPWQVSRVTPDFTQLLGVAPALGRAFAADDAKGEAASVALLSDAAWRSRFAADPAVVGRTLRFGGANYTIAGVMPAGFAFPDRRADAWIPLVWSAQERQAHAQSFLGELSVIARLAPGASIAQARERLGALLAQDEKLAPKFKDDDPQPRVTPLRDRYAGTARTLDLMQLAALILLAAVVASVVNLMFDRVLARARTQAIRRALGASDMAIAIDAAVDLALPLLGGLLAGLAFAPFGLRLLQGLALLPPSLPQGGELGAAAVGAGLVVVLLVLAASLAALPSRRAPHRAAQRHADGLGRARKAMLVAQVTLATAMMGSVVLLARSAVNVLDVDRGFDGRGVLMTSIDALDVAGARQRGETPKASGEGFALDVEALRADVAGLPGVRHAAVAAMPPFSGLDSSGVFGLPGLTDKQHAREREVGRGFFSAMGIDFLAGEDFRVDGEPATAVVDERFVARYLGAENPLGARIDLTDEQGELHPARIVGVVRAVKNGSLEESEALPMIYRSMSPQWSNFWLVTRGGGADPATLATAVRERVLTHFPHARIGVNAALDDLVSDSLADRRHLLAAIGGFALAALALAAVGLAAVLAFAVRRRTAELGVRMALGATPARVRALVLRQGGALIVCGLLLGTSLGLALARLLADRLFGIGYADAASWSIALALVAAVALGTCWLPARRAAATDPIEALRHE
ncbi:ABC transporter permease [Dokdonella sp.]|uniref:ABC transporter permease n=1 Tax=Dokdonella sp. TaxID=2291710 RepID=UPI001B205FA2|nr:ABC transporter permease [Dokdonella sp.]MBO9663915.1 ABC transporter permease [Dokdonella sp.]